MRSLNLSWSEVRYGRLKEICEAVEIALASAGVDFYYLIGAQARDLWSAGESVETRITRDVDFAILVADADQYETVKELLRTNHGFDDSKENAFSMRSPDGTTVDILPYGGIEEDDKIIAGGEGLTSMHVNGFKEVAAAGTVEALFDEGKSKFHLATLPAIALLKFISYDDRPEIRGKDAGDIMQIIRTYFDLQPDMFYDIHHDVLEAIDEGHEKIAARVIGREMRTILLESEPLEARIRTIVTAHLSAGSESKFIDIMSATAGISTEQATDILDELRAGLDEVAPG